MDASSITFMQSVQISVFPKTRRIGNKKRGENGDEVAEEAKMGENGIAGASSEVVADDAESGDGSEEDPEFV